MALAQPCQNVSLSRHNGKPVPSEKGPSARHHPGILSRPPIWDRQRVLPATGHPRLSCAGWYRLISTMLRGRDRYAEHEARSIDSAIDSLDVVNRIQRRSSLTRAKHPGNRISRPRKPPHAEICRDALVQRLLRNPPSLSGPRPEPIPSGCALSAF